MDQVSVDEDLLDIARDCFHFVTKFFEPIDLSAAHIYHSALELCPLSSIVRRLYYHQSHVPLPRVVAGIPNSWDQRISISDTSESGPFTWSPCGQFVAAFVGGAVEIRDALSTELVSTFAEPGDYSDRGRALAYSPDGRSLAYLSDVLKIWDIQTGGEAKEIECNASSNCSVVWSLDGGTVGMTRDPTVHVYDLASGTIYSPGTLQSSDKLHLWAHDKSFRIMTTGWEGEVFTVEIFEVGSDLTKIESFHIKVWESYPQIKSFSPTTYRISTPRAIVDIRNSERLLYTTPQFTSQCFSPDGSLFAVSQPPTAVRVWKYDSGRYTPWREFPTPGRDSIKTFPLQFSPTSPSILGHCGGTLRVFRLDGPPAAAHPAPIAVLSPCATYMVAGREGGQTLTITNPHSQTTLQFIDTDMEIETLFLTANVLVVSDRKVLTAWRLTDEGLVAGVFGNRKADRSDSIWVVSVAPHKCPKFAVKGQTVAVKGDEKVIHAYHAGTGEILEPAQIPPLSRTDWYRDLSMYGGEHYLRHHNLKKLWDGSGSVWPGSWAPLRNGWVEDPEGKHRLWMPIEWRKPLAGGWHSNITAVSLRFYDRTVIVMF